MMTQVIFPKEGEILVCCECNTEVKANFQAGECDDLEDYFCEPCLDFVDVRAVKKVSFKEKLKNMKNRFLSGIVGLMLAVTMFFAAPVPAKANIWCTLFGLDCPIDVTKNAFVPKFYPNVTVQSPFAGATVPANSDYFAMPETAAKACSLLGCTKVYEQKPCSLGGGPVTCSAPELYLAFPTGDKNAGIIASFWARNPDSVALSLAKKAILQ